jgi:hypothetical protein
VLHWCLRCYLIGRRRPNLAGGLLGPHAVVGLPRRRELTHVFWGISVRLPWWLTRLFEHRRLGGATCSRVIRRKEFRPRSRAACGGSLRLLVVGTEAVAVCGTTTLTLTQTVAAANASEGRESCCSSTFTTVRRWTAGPHRQGALDWHGARIALGHGTHKIRAVASQASHIAGEQRRRGGCGGLARAARIRHFTLGQNVGKIHVVDAPVSGPRMNVHVTPSAPRCALRRICTTQTRP